MALKGKLETAMLTHVGRVRHNNEDAVGENAELGLVVLADGMGGYNAGEIASGLAVATILDAVQRRWPKVKVGQVDAATGHTAEALALREAVTLAHQTIHGVAASQPQCAGMGTTVVAAQFVDDRVVVAHVGDSRLYRLRKGRLEQLTRDHSLVEELVARGHYSREEALQLVRKNVITRALGVEEEVTVDLLEEAVEVGDVFLLCSDGLTDMVPDPYIATLIGDPPRPLPEAVESLIDAALDAGGRDNVSVILAQAVGSFARGRPWYARWLEWF